MLSLFDIEDEVTKITLNLPKNLIRDYCANPEAPLDSSIDQNTIELLADINQNPHHPRWESLIVRHYSKIMQVDRGTLSPRDTYLRLARVDTVTQLIEFRRTLPSLFTISENKSYTSYDIPGKDQYWNWHPLSTQEKFVQVTNYDSLEDTFSPLADSTITDGDGNSVLALAVSAGKMDIVKCLIKHGAQVNQWKFDGEPPLIYAAQKGYIEIFEYLLKNGANINLQGKSKDTALIAATRNKHIDIIKLLLKSNADANLKDHGGENVLSIASRIGDTAIVELLLSDEKLTPANHEEAIFAAASAGQPEILSLLLKDSSSLEIQDNFGLTPLAWAAYSGQAKTAAFLLARGANIKHTTKAAGNILYLAQHGYSRGDLEGKEKQKATMQVLNNACTIEILAHQYGETPLKSLILYGNAGVLLAILCHGLKNKAGFAALVIGAGVGLTLGLSEDVRDEIDLPTWAISVISVAVSALILLTGNAIIRKSHGPALTFEYTGPTSNNTSITTTSLPSGPNLK